MLRCSSTPEFNVYVGQERILKGLTGEGIPEAGISRLMSSPVGLRPASRADPRQVAALSPLPSIKIVCKCMIVCTFPPCGSGLLARTQSI